MNIARTLPSDDEKPETHVFKCSYCKLDFITEDHVPVAGPSVR